MSDYSISLNGLMAQTTAMRGYASNIANMQSIGTPGGKNAYIPVDPVQISGAGGPQTIMRPVDPASYSAYAPSSALSDSDGMVSVPNVNLDEQFVGMIQVENAYKANIAAIRTRDSMDEALLDIIS